MKVKNTNTQNYQKLENTGTEPDAKSGKSSWFFRMFVIRPFIYVKSFFTHGQGSEESPTIVRKTGESLGEGARGKVVKAELNDRKVAHKIMHHSRKEEQLLYKTVRDENAILAELDHPHIVKNVGAGKSGEVVSVDYRELDAGLHSASPEQAEYIDVKGVEEHDNSVLLELAGSSLDELITTLPGNRKRHALNLLSAVSYLHDKNYCHLDIKPANVLWSKEKGVQLCDFNDAVKVNASKRIPSNVRSITYTTFYAAPEFIRNPQELPRMPFAFDSWSLGCTLAELITQEPLFTHDDFFDERDSLKDPSEIPYEKRVQEYLAKHEKTLGKDICEILRGMLEVNPEKRLDVKDALNRFPYVFSD